MTVARDHLEHTHASPADPTVDEHRFSSEASRPKSSKRLMMVFVGLAAVLAVMGIGVLVAKTAYSKHMAERSEKQRIEREKSVDTERKGKVFPKEAAPAPIAAASAPALPTSFSQTKGARESVAPIPLATLPSGAVSPPPPPAPRDAATAAPRKPTMMLAAPEITANQQSGTWAPANAPSIAPTAQSLATPSPTAATAPTSYGSVQDMARAQALKSPPTASNQSSAAKLGDRSMLIARGAYVPCGLETDLISTVPGPTSCVVTSNVYSDDGRVVLIEKGARILGEYRNTLKQGDTRIAVLWNRIKTPTGVVIDVDSPAANGTGAAGVEGQIDNHWMQRIGAAFLLSLVQDAVAIKATQDGGGVTVVNTTNTSKSMAEKVLDSTINIPPTLVRSRGDRLMVLVNRDLWFDSVYSIGKRP
jgi:type IV secretion system protein VirB10